MINGLKHSGILIILLLLGSNAVNSQSKPNIIMFIADDTDKYQIGCYGGPVYTPNLDSLAAQGALFHHAYVNAGHSLNERGIFGGTEDGNREARIDSSQRIMEFLERVSEVQPHMGF